MTKPIVQTTYGPIFGEVRDGISIFRGIPYGGRVDGDRRWLPPTWFSSADIPNHPHIPIRGPMQKNALQYRI